MESVSNTIIYREYIFPSMRSPVRLNSRSATFSLVFLFPFYILIKATELSQIPRVNTVYPRTSTPCYTMAPLPLRGSMPKNPAPSKSDRLLSGHPAKMRCSSAIALSPSIPSMVTYKQHPNRAGLSSTRWSPAQTLLASLLRLGQT